MIAEMQQKLEAKDAMRVEGGDCGSAAAIATISKILRPL